MKKIIFTLLIGIIFISSCKKNTTNAIDHTVKDIDGNVYDTIVIGTQVWMKQNLRVTHYNDGTPIPTGLSNLAWSTATSGAYAIYYNDPVYDTTFGKLYNWFAVNTGKIAPAGWRVPTDADWTALGFYLGGGPLAGNKMKDTTIWNPWAGIVNTNSSGFTGLPAGVRNADGTYSLLGKNAFFWSSTEYNTFLAWYDYLFYADSNLTISYVNKLNGLSIRCIRN